MEVPQRSPGAEPRWGVKVIPTWQNIFFSQLFQIQMNTERFVNFVNCSGLSTIQLRDKLYNKITLFAGRGGSRGECRHASSPPPASLSLLWGVCIPVSPL